MADRTANHKRATKCSKPKHVRWDSNSPLKRPPTPPFCSAKTPKIVNKNRWSDLKRILYEESATRTTLECWRPLYLAITPRRARWGVTVPNEGVTLSSSKDFTVLTDERQLTITVKQASKCLVTLGIRQEAKIVQHTKHFSKKRTVKADSLPYLGKTTILSTPRVKAIVEAIEPKTRNSKMNHQPAGPRMCLRPKAATSRSGHQTKNAQGSQSNSLPAEPY